MENVNTDIHKRDKYIAPIIEAEDDLSNESLLTFAFETAGVQSGCGGTPEACSGG